MRYESNRKWLMRSVPRIHGLPHHHGRHRGRAPRRPASRRRSVFSEGGWQSREPAAAGQDKRGGKCKARLYAGFCAAGFPAVAIIRLGPRSRAGSSHLPAASPSRIAGCLFGVAARRDCPFHPSRRRNAGPTRLCCSDPHLSVGRCYLLRRSVQSGRSSRGAWPPAIARRALPD